MADEVVSPSCKVLQLLGIHRNIILFKGADQDDYDDDDTQQDSKLMPPPSWVPNQSELVLEADKRAASLGQSGHMTDKLLAPPGVHVKTEPLDDESYANLKTPLAAMLPKEFEDVDVKDWFPEFRPGKVCSVSSYVETFLPLVLCPLPLVKCSRACPRVRFGCNISFLCILGLFVMKTGLFQLKLSCDKIKCQPCCCILG